MWGKPQRWTFRCSSCGWHRTTPPTGDVRMTGLTHFSSCPNCGAHDLTCKPATHVEALWQALRGHRPPG